MQPTTINAPHNRGYVIQDNANGHGPYIGVYVNFDESTKNCTVTTTLEVGNGTYNYYSGTYLEVWDGSDFLYNVNGNSIQKGSQRFVITESKTYEASGHCRIYARFAQAVGAQMTNYERWNFSTSPIEFDAIITPNAPNNVLTWTDGTFYDGGDMNCGVFRLFCDNDKTKLQCVDIKRSAANAVDIKNELWCNGQLIRSENSDFKINFKESDRGKLFTLKSCSISSTNTVVQGNDINWYINDLPVMDASKIITNVNRTKDKVILYWGKAVDKINKDNKITYKIHIRKKDSNGNYITDNEIDTVEGTFSQEINLLNYSIGKGESAYLSVEPSDYLERSYKLYGDVKVTINSAPYFSKGTLISSNVDAEPYVGLFKDNVKITWNTAFDKENDKLTYNIYYSINKNRNNPSWSNWQYLSSTTNLYTISNCQTYVGKGEQIKFGIVAYDGLEKSCPDGSVSITSKVLTRDIEPLPPKSYTLYPKKDEIHYETITKFEWSTSKCLNGKDCDNYLVEIWTGKEKDTSKATKIFSNYIKSNSMYYDISRIARGNYFFFKVYSSDIYDLKSESCITTKFYRRNQVPETVKNFRVNSSKKNFYKTVPLIWDKSTDPDNDSVTYTIYFSKNNANSYDAIATGLTQTTYSHNINNLQANDKLNYKIIAVDKFNVHSSETLLKNSGNIVVNTKPETPTLIYPLSGIYDSTPRILLKTAGDKNNDNLIIKIKINGTEYNCATSTLFNKTLYSCIDDKIIFIPPALKEGTNTITVKANDGYEDSVEKSYNIIYKKPLLEQIDNKNTYITTNIFYDLFTMVNDTRKAYGKTALTKPNITKDKSLITSDNFILIYNGIKDITNFINNNYPGKDRIAETANIVKSAIITKDIYNAILKNIKNV